MIGDKKECPFYERCGLTGHFTQGGKVYRCECLQLRINKSILGTFHCSDPFLESALIKHKDSNLLIECPSFSTIRRHVAGVLLDMESVSETFKAFDSYQLVDIFFGKDNEMVNFSPLVDPDLSIILLGFTEIVNRLLPEMILQVLSRRQLRHKVTWIVLGIPREQIAKRFGHQLHSYLEGFEYAFIKPPQ